MLERERDCCKERRVLDHHRGEATTLTLIWIVPLKVPVFLRPARISMSVVLPAPDGPMIALHIVRGESGQVM